MRFETLIECLHFEICKNTLRVIAEGGVWHWCSVGCIVSSTACLLPPHSTWQGQDLRSPVTVKPLAFPPFLSNTRTPDLNLIVLSLYQGNDEGYHWYQIRLLDTYLKKTV